ncbi:hypothetical protein OH76DRAFT_1423985 [Lentinus brumalis]|uniref:Uncharacterized protein n=1 Tax=Lentinus brumalis TaxID=2498619 RepID=A0A371CI65_9APHY|nr:hypothetical protein OH76DRAFT_1423985 [Polyporus brumalis]
MSTNAITQTVPRKKKVKSPNEDPTEGDGRRWVTGVKFEFLTGRLPLWHDARDFGEMSNFYSRVTLLFVRFFTWEHALDPDGNGPAEEPSEDNLNEELNVTGLEPDEVARRNAVYIELRSKIQRWFRYHGTKALKSKGADPLAKILKAFKTQDKPPRRMQTLQFYSKLYYDTRIKATVDAEWPKIVAQAGAKGAPPPKRLKHQNTVVARKFAAETAEFQVALKRQRDAEFEEEYAAWKACSLDSMDVPKTAEEYALALEEASGWIHPLAESLSKRVGLNVSILLTGPIGSSGGRIDVKAVHAGESSGLTPKLWPDYDARGYEALLKSLIGFAKACFSQQECRDRALPGTTPPDGNGVPASFPSSSVITVAPGGVNGDTVVRTVPLCIPQGPATASPTAESAASSPVSAPLPPPPAAATHGTMGSRSPSEIAMPAPLRMVSRLSSSTGAAGVPLNAVMPASTRSTEPIYGHPSILRDMACANVPPTPTVLETTPTDLNMPTSPLPPNDTSPSVASSTSLDTMTSGLAALSATPVSSSTGTKRSLPPPSSSPTVESSTPPTEVSVLPSSSPSPTLAEKVASPRRMRASPAPMSISAGPRTFRAPGPPASISAGPALGRSTSSGRSVSLSAGSLSTGPGPAPFSKINDQNCPSNIVDIIQYLKAHQWGPIWDHCIATWVEIERFAQFKTRGALQNPTEGRPLEVAAWMKRARKLVDFPIKDVDKFAAAWLTWWKSNKPVAQDTDNVRANWDWGVLNVSGPNGILLFMLSLAWWGAVVEHTQGYQGKWLLAVSDVRLVLDRVLLAAAKGYRDEDADEGDADLQVSVSRTSRKRQHTAVTPAKGSAKVTYKKRKTTKR